jgi:hypothetical protein
MRWFVATKAKKEKAPATDGRIVAFGEDAFWIGMAAKVAGLSQAEFVRERFRECVRDELQANGVDPDRAYAKAQVANQQ